MPVKLDRHIHYAKPIQIHTTISNRPPAPRIPFVQNFFDEVRRRAPAQQ